MGKKHASQYANFGSLHFKVLHNNHNILSLNITQILFIFVFPCFTTTKGLFVFSAKETQFTNIS